MAACGDIRWNRGGGNTPGHWQVLVCFGSGRKSWKARVGRQSVPWWNQHLVLDATMRGFGNLGPYFDAMVAGTLPPWTIRKMVRVSPPYSALPFEQRMIAMRTGGLIPGEPIEVDVPVPDPDPRFEWQQWLDDLSDWLNSAETGGALYNAMFDIPLVGPIAETFFPSVDELFDSESGLEPPIKPESGQTPPFVPDVQSSGPVQVSVDSGRAADDSGPVWLALLALLLILTRRK